MNAKVTDQSVALNCPAVEEPSLKVVLIEYSTTEVKKSFLDKFLSQKIELLNVFPSLEGLGAKLVSYSPDALILSVDAIDSETLKQLVEVNRLSPLPVVVFSQQHAPELMDEIIESGVSAYIVDDVEAHRLPVIIDLAVARFAKMHDLHKELQQTKHKLSERKLIEKAKGIIMLQKNVSEEQAYSHMRSSAMNQGKSIAELAKNIINVFEILD